MKAMKKESLQKTKMLAAVLLLAAPVVAGAQEHVEADLGADLVSGYLWRGQDLGNVSIQPSVSVSYKGFWVGAWGSVGLDKDDTKEIDLTVGYAAGGFSVSVTDYWTDGGAGYFHYGARNTRHVFEAQLGYDLGFDLVYELCRKRRRYPKRRTGVFFVLLGGGAVPLGRAGVVGRGGRGAVGDGFL